jgi:hypothetical protein
MNIDRTQQILGSDRTKTSKNTDTFININLEGSEKLLPIGEINHVVDITEQFDKERNENKFFRIIGTINPTISNSLFDLTSIALNKFTWAGFNSTEFIVDNITYTDAVKKYLLERDGWFGYTDPNKLTSGLCNFIDMEPKRERFSFLPDTRPFRGGSTPVKNWNLTITYPRISDKTHNMVNGGLLIVDAKPANVSGRNMTAFGVACLHNLIIGNIVKLSGLTIGNSEHVVIRTGLDNGDLKSYYFVVDIPYTNNLISSNSRFKRMFGGIESEYYFRIFTKVKTRSAEIIENDDYETYQAGFSENSYNDSITQFVFNEDINITDLKDNLGRPVTELYLTTIKTDSDTLFGGVSSGIETPFIENLNTSSTNTYLLNIPSINKIHNGGKTPFTSHTPLETNITEDSYSFYGDLVEFNKNEVIETVLADVMHRFNTNNRETGPTLTYVIKAGDPPVNSSTVLGPRQEGYYYKPHKLIRVRELSSYVEQGDPIFDEIPDYATPIDDGRYFWRDVLPIGVNEDTESETNYPFLNGCHYVYLNNSFYVRRQDPFNNWNLYWAKFPADPNGERMTNKFNINTEDDVC